MQKEELIRAVAENYWYEPVCTCLFICSLHGCNTICRLPWAIFPAGPGYCGAQPSSTFPSVSLPSSTTGYAYSATPGPSQTVPDYEEVSVTVDRNTITENPVITTMFNGEMGLGMTVRMDVTVIRSDGGVETGHVDYPAIGSDIALMGTTATDRGIITVTMTSGDQYTVIDQYYPFPGSGNTG